jgi:ParB family transcriptional regulator, chromosome partitioning protein
MTTSNAAADTAAKTGTEKAHEKLAEKRRALGRGLESLLPGPRVVPAPPARATAAPTLPQSTRKDGAPDSASSQFSVPSSQEPGSAPSSPGTDGGRAPEVVGELQGAAAGKAPEGEQAFELALDQIEQNPYQTRTEFEPNALAELAASIQEQGVLQPIVVRPATVPRGSFGLTYEGAEIVPPEIAGSLPPLAPARPGGKARYILILGERRFRASKMAGKTTIPAIVKRVSEQQAAEMTLVENLQRQDLHCLEQAAAFARLSTDFRLTQEAIGKRVGVSREQVSNYLRLLRLPREVLDALRNNELTYSHARLLLSLGEESQIVKVARLVIAKKMSVALLEEKVIDSHIPKGDQEERQQGGARWVDPNVRAAQRSLEAVLGMRVRIRDRRGKGKIVIEYGTLEDFDRVVGMLKGK